MDKDDNTESGEGIAKPKLSAKERAKKLRHEAYQRAKEFKKNDPREIARKAAAKEQRKAFYQKAKERAKASQKAVKEKPDLRNKIMLATDPLLDARPLAPVISIDFKKVKRSKK